jgi:hypothetical protein
MRDATGAQARHITVKLGPQLINALALGMRGRARGAMAHMTSVYATLVLVPRWPTPPQWPGV